MSGVSHGHGPSTKSIYLIFIATFMFGFLCGVVLFLQNHTGEEGDGGTIPVNTKGFTILAFSYGGCTRASGCPTYRLTDSGAYTYITRDTNQEEKRTEDTLSKKQLLELKMRMDSAQFDALKNTTFTGSCPTSHDGIAYRYDIEYKGTQYSFDSCVDSLDESELFKSLEGYFEVFRIVQGT